MPTRVDYFDATFAEWMIFSLSHIICPPDECVRWRQPQLMPPRQISYADIDAEAPQPQHARFTEALMLRHRCHGRDCRRLPRRTLQADAVMHRKMLLLRFLLRR